MNDVLKLSVEQLMLLESLKKGSENAIAQTFALVLMFFLTPPFEQIGWYRYFCVHIFVVLILRWYWVRKDEKFCLYHGDAFMWIGVSNAIPWVIVIGLAIHHLKLSSAIGLLHYVLTFAILAAVYQVLATTRKYLLVFSGIIGTGVSLVLFLGGNAEERLCSYVLFAFTIFVNVSNSKFSMAKKRLELEKEVAIEHNKLRSLFKAIPGFIVLADLDGTWTENNLSEEISEYAPLLRAEIYEFIKSGSKEITKEIEIPHSTGAQFYLLSLAYDETHVIATGLPISDLKHAQHTARLSSIGEMAAGISHEINNPLAVISLSADKLARRLSAQDVDPEIWEPALKEISKTVMRISDIVVSLRNLSRQDRPLDDLHVSLSKVLSDVVNISRERMISNGVSIKFVMPESEVWVHGRHVELGQIIVNLINNAFDAVAGKGGEIDINVEETDDFVYLRVGDDGEGITPNVSKKLFQPFFTTKPIGQGTGLGLSISRSIAIKYGGNLELYKTSNPTIFQLKLKKR